MGETDFGLNPLFDNRYTGIITGIGDIEPSRWPVSKWRSLKVEWDGTSNDISGSLAQRIQSSVLRKLDNLQKVSHEQRQQMISQEYRD